MKVLQEISKVATSSLPTQVVAATVGAKLQQFKFKDGSDLEFCAFQQLVKPTRRNSLGFCYLTRHTRIFCRLWPHLSSLIRLSSAP